MKSLLSVLCLMSFSMAFKVSGYLPSWRALPTESQYAMLDELNISFLEFDGTLGNVKTEWSDSDISIMVQSMHAKGGKALISFWGTGADSPLMGNSSHRQNLVHNLVQFVATHNLDGIDVDWEPQYQANEVEMKRVTQVITDYLNPFLRELRDSINTRWPQNNKLLTIAIANKNQVWYADGASSFMPSGFSQYVDYVHLMNYDDGIGAEHSTFNATFSLMSGSVSHWVDQGVPQDKIIPGMPFYARCSWTTAVSYSDLFTQYSSLDTTLDAVSVASVGGSTCGYNGVTTIHNKTAEALRIGLPGVMFWELGQDVLPESPYSLLSAIRDIVPRNASPILPRLNKFNSTIQWQSDRVIISGLHHQIQLVSLQGKLIPLQIYFNENSTIASWASLPTGVYFLTANGVKLSQKVISAH